MPLGFLALDGFVLGYVVGLDLITVAGHRYREPVLGELRQFFVLVVCLNVVYFALLARARRCRVKELFDNDPFSFTRIRGKRVCEDLLV